MKKIILVLAVAASLVSCKSDWDCYCVAGTALISENDETVEVHDLPVHNTNPWTYYDMTRGQARRMCRDSGIAAEYLHMYSDVECYTEKR